MSCPNIKANLEELAKGLELDFKRALSVAYSPIEGVFDLVKNFVGVDGLDVKGFWNNISNIKDVFGSNFLGAILYAVTQLLAASNGILQKAITAHVLMNLSDELKHREALMTELLLNVNMIKTAVHIMSLIYYKRGDDSLSRTIGAANHTKLAFIRGRQLIDVWEARGIFHKGLYDNMRGHITAAQEYLISPELAKFEREIQEKLSELGIASTTAGELLDIDSLFRVLRSSAEQLNPYIPKTELALAPLANFIINDIEDKAVRLAFSYNLALQAMLNISRLVPYDPTEKLTLINSAGLILSQGPIDIDSVMSSINTYFGDDGSDDTAPQTLVEINSNIYLMMSGLKNIKEKWLSFDFAVSPFIKLINDAVLGLRALYYDMRETVKDPTLTSKDLVLRRTAWAGQLSSVEGRLLVLTPDARKTLDATTEFAAQWNSVLAVIDDTDLDTYSPSRVYSETIKTIMGIPIASIDQTTAELLISTLASTQLSINRAIIFDSSLYRAIDNLELEETTDGLPLVRNIMDLLDKEFPAFGYAFQILDLASITSTIIDISKQLDGMSVGESINAAFKAPVAALIDNVKKTKLAGALNCIGENVGVDDLMGDIDDMLTDSLSGSKDEQEAVPSRMLSGIEGWYAKESASLEKTQENISKGPSI